MHLQGFSYWGNSLEATQQFIHEVHRLLRGRQCAPPPVVIGCFLPVPDLTGSSSAIQSFETLPPLMPHVLPSG